MGNVAVIKSPESTEKFPEGGLEQKGRNDESFEIIRTSSECSLDLEQVSAGCADKQLENLCLTRPQ